MPAADIVIKGAREHNLRDVNLTIPRNQLVCLTGVSGSGKSSLAFDTLYAEGQRRYVESLSSFARQFLGQMPKPDVDLISGLSPSISISQKTAGSNPRSTVGTITEIYDYLRVLFARVGDGYCPKCGKAISSQSREQLMATILSLPSKTKFSVLAPLIKGQKGEYKDLFVDLLKQGFVRARVDGNTVSLSDDLKLDRQMRHNIELVIDRLENKPSVRTRLAEAVELALKIGKGSLIIELEDANAADNLPTPANVDSLDTDDFAESSDTSNDAEETVTRKGRGKRLVRNENDMLLSTEYACTDCNLSFEPPSPQLFSFNSPQGMCHECDGLGEYFSFDPELLIPDGNLSFKQGCFAYLGPWKEMGRWRRHIFQGVADTMERKLEIEEGTLLETAWDDLTEDLQHLWLWGTDDEHITYTWRNGKSPQMYGGKFEGIVPELLSKYRGSQSKMQIRALEKYMSTVECASCAGLRLNEQARSVKVTSLHPHFADHPSLTLPEICSLSVADAAHFFTNLQLDDTRQLIAKEVLKEIRGRLGFLMNVGLDYLSLDRSAPTLSGGEAQRIRLAGQIGCGLVGVLYILDEPSIGLHPRDNDRLIRTLADLRDLGNTVVVVEHDEDTMLAADHIIDFGPGPGVRGGYVVAEGPAEKVTKAKDSVTGKFLSGQNAIAVPTARRIAANTSYSPDLPTLEAIRQEQEANGKSSRRRAVSTKPDEVRPAPAENWLTITGARHNNLKDLTINIPLGAFVCITGVSGSGKSSFVNDILVETLRRDLNRGDGEPGDHDAIYGLEHLDKLIAIDQTPIGRTPRSNPGTYIKVFDDIRTLFTQLPDAKRRGFKPGRFSFNVKGGRCEACEGNGSTKLEMDFLADVWVTCPVCEGHRFNRETLSVRFKDKSIAEVLEMDIQQALEFFDSMPKIRHKLQTLHDVGLDYLKIGQPSPTLSGGEAQRVKLAKELVKVSTGKTLYLLDEPTTGLHFADIEILLKVLHDFVEAGNTVLVVEHNLDVIKTADWIIDLGPEGGAGGGQIVVTGTPEEVAACKTSETGQALARTLSHSTQSVAAKVKAARAIAAGKNGRATNGNGNGATNGNAAPFMERIQLQGAKMHNLKGVDLELPRDAMSVFCGPSGSGKSSLAMDTIYAEGQRRYVESLSSYARQFVSQMQKPELEHIEGLSPAIAIEQQNLGKSPRSTVGTTTEIYDYLRILIARLGTPHCPDCDLPIGTQTADQIVDKIMSEPEGTKLYLTAPASIEVGQAYEMLWDELRTQGYVRIRVDGFTHELDRPPQIDRRRKHDVSVVVDRIVVKESSRSRIAESVEGTLALGKGVMQVIYPQDNTPEPRWPVRTHSQHLVCEKCSRSFEPLTPHNFSFNSHLGWCESCEGLGTQTGANPAALLRSGKFTLEQGAIALWPDLNRDVSKWMLAALSNQTGIPLDVPFDELDGRQRRLLYYGTGDTWLDVFSPKSKQEPLFRYQFKGLYPALEEAARLSPGLRSRLEHLVDEVECAHCGGSRLRDDAAAVRFRDMTIDQLCRQPLGQLQETVKQWKMSARERKIAGELVREVQNRVDFLNDVGLEYLTLARQAATLSGGEAQRIRLASQLGSGLCGVLYVLDEPTIGLHPRDNIRLIRALHKLRDLGNTLVLVEHDKEVIEHSDYVVDFGPAAGKNGGQVVAEGSADVVGKKRNSVTGPYLSGKKAIAIPSNRRISEDAANAILSKAVTQAAPPHAAAIAPPKKKKKKTAKKTSTDAAEKKATEDKTTNTVDVLTLVGVTHNNLKNANVKIPLGTLTAITGVSGSGKSSIVNDVLHASLAKTLHRASAIPGAHERIDGIEYINKVVRVDQHPLGNSPSSNPATYTGVFDLIRTLFSNLPDSKIRGYTQRRFSFNVPGGRCEACEGNGQRCIEMHFLPDVWVECETCRGKRYNEETLAVTFHGHSIADVLDLTCADAVKLFENIPQIRRILQTLCDVGLDYLTLGQPAPTLSGGEAQRVKLAAELSRPDTGRTLYLLDEPTTGLHFSDLEKLLVVLNRLVDLGNTVVVIEHNLDVIKTADWIIDVGPEAGDGGGQIVFEGTPEMLVEYAKQTPLKKTIRKKKSVRKTTSTKPKKRTAASALPSLTGVALIDILAAGPYEKRSIYDPMAEEAPQEGDKAIEEVGEAAEMPWETDGRKWHTEDRVGRKGEACRWDGKILAAVVDRIQQQGDFLETNWNSRTIVEINGQKKSHGWFFHAITGEAWLLKMKFRTTKGTFRREELLKRLDLPTLNQMEDLPIYGNEARVSVKSIRGPWQEIEVRAHTWEEIDSPEFWEFVDQAVTGFQKFAEKADSKPDMLAPWKKLGMKWHFSTSGFTPGRRLEWDHSLLEHLCELLESSAQGVTQKSEFLWNNKQLVHLMVPGVNHPWATVITKRAQNLELTVNGPKSHFGLGRVAEIGMDRSIDTSNQDFDSIRLRFRKKDDLNESELVAFLNEHLTALTSTS